MGELSTVIDELLAAPLDDFSTAEHGDFFVELMRQSERLEAAALRHLGRFTAAGGYEVEGSKSPAAWTAEKLRSTYSYARVRVRMARRLQQLPQTAAALAAGDINIGHARVICAKTSGKVAEAIEQSEGVVVEAARNLPPDLLQRVITRIKHCTDPESSNKDRIKQFDEREVFASPGMDGVVHLNGTLDQECGEATLVALDAEMARQRTVNDPRTSPQLRHDALHAIMRRSLDAGDFGQMGGVRPHLSVITTPETLAGMRGSPPADLAATGPLLGESARRIACDSVVSRLLMTADGQPLYAGRATRIWNPSQRRAITARDRGCRYRGCRRPPMDCEIHHIVHWADGGPTDIDNGVMLCWFHHFSLHERGWPLDLRPVTAPLGSRERAPP